MTTTQDPSETRPDPALRAISLVVVLGTVMTMLDATIVNVAINVLGRDLGVSLSTVQWTVTGYTLALSMTIPITGWAIGRFGAKSTWITSLALFGAGSVLCGAAWSAGALIAFRVLQGVGGGLLMPVAQTLLTRAAGPERMGRTMAVISIPSMLAPVLGPLLGGVLVDHLSWRWMFYVNVPVCALALLLAVRLLPREERRADSRLDALGLALLSPGLAALVYGLSQTGEASGGSRALAGLVFGVVLTAAFCAHSLRRGERALLDVALFRDRGLAASAAALFCYSVGVFGVLLLVPLYSQSVPGTGVLDAGLLIAPMGAGAIVTMPLAGRLTDRLGAHLPGIAGIVTVLAGIFACARVDMSAGASPLAAALFVIGLGHGLVTPSIMAAAYRTLPRSVLPGAATASQIVIRVGTALGAAVITVILQTLTRGSDGPQAAAFEGSLLWATAIVAVALVPALLIPRRQAAP
ncbi:DHA2 family efflux MFS transporter permease subunit [Streptosporangium carneum]|uniref:MFS transporter n=1 Tax=Streptosporangium carneum TaxID=47481 RepID=A0A9W6HZ50_9ACTN|nr:DHA2 family efflux MFS transporter permease subunit [Streptosporangium carneum]GLK08243.1 MFS transporter [Streptosporangium carneum]